MPIHPLLTNWSRFRIAGDNAWNNGLLRALRQHRREYA
jgi:hypothetical protein